MILPILAALAVLGPYSSSGNFSADLLGTRDTRPDTWGNADAAGWTIQFRPPAGYRVRILKLRGIWWHGLGCSRVSPQSLEAHKPGCYWDS